MSPNPFSMATEVSPSLLPPVVQVHEVHEMMKLHKEGYTGGVSLDPRVYAVDRASPVPSMHLPLQ